MTDTGSHVTLRIHLIHSMPTFDTLSLLCTFGMGFYSVACSNLRLDRVITMHVHVSPSLHYFSFPLLKTVAEKKRSAKSEAQRSSLRLLVDYLSHVKLIHALNRNLSLIVGMRDGDRAVKPEEFVRVYDILLQVGTCR